jgi:predicted dehydrogenase
MSEIRVALIGCGGMGRGLVDQLVTVPGAVIAAGVDPFPGARESFADAYSVPTFATTEELLAADVVDAVIVATPNDGHAPNTIAAAGAGKHVFCEKPMALNLGECRAMIEACATAGVKLQIGQVLRYLPDFDYALKMLRAGDLGIPLHGTIFRYGGPRTEWGGETWRDKPERVGHYLFEVAVHEIDFARCVFGRPVAVSGWDICFDPASPLWAQATTGVIEFESGAVCTITEGMYNPIGRSEVEIAGTGGAVRFHWGQDFTYRSLSGREDFDKTGAEIGEGVENGVRREVREWIEAIANDTPATIPGEEGMANIELALAILQSSRDRTRLELPLQG